MQSVSRPTVLLVGSWNDDEFRQPVRDLRAQARLTAVPTLADACRLLDDSHRRWHPELIVLAQSRPGQFSRRRLLELLRRRPLARVIVLLGSWCEGETRTGVPLPAAHRLFWYQWEARFQIDRRRRAAGTCPAWGLPETADAEDRLLLPCEIESTGGGRVLVAGRSRETVDALADACRSVGYQPVRAASLSREARPVRPRPAGAVVGLWEGVQCDGPEAKRLGDWARALDGVPVVVLLDFPRADALRRAWRAGARSVLAKPFQLQELAYHLDQAAAIGRGRRADDVADARPGRSRPRLAG